MSKALTAWVKTWGLEMQTVLVLIVQVAILGILLPWSKEVNTQLTTLREFQAATKSWMEQGPRFTTKDADNLKLTIRDEMSRLVVDSFDKLSKRIQDLEDMRRRDTEALVSRLNAATESSTLARLSSEHLTQRVGELTGRFADLRAEMRQFFIDADFSKNSQPK
jgi:hypothetical protein